MRLLDKQNIEDIAIGSAVLGTGGGGNPYLGKLTAQRAIDEYGPLKLVKADELSDDTLVVAAFGIGSPVPFIERLSIDDDLMYAYNALNRYLGREIGAIMSVEIGGMNSVVPFAIAAKLGLPVVDLDCMGRAFPQVQLKTLTMYGHIASPVAVADQHGNLVIVDSIDSFWAERLARRSTVEFGAIAGGVGWPITIRDLKVAAVLDTVSLAETIGIAIREARAEHRDPITAVTETTNGFRVFSGRIVDVSRRIERGWALGETTIAGTDQYTGRTMKIHFQNEHLIALEDGKAVITVPDLITILDSERGDPIMTEELRYGFRVTVIGMPCDPRWRSPAGLALAGPDHWGYDVPFVPVEERFAAGVASS